MAEGAGRAVGAAASRRCRAVLTLSLLVLAAPRAAEAAVPRAAVDVAARAKTAVDDGVVEQLGAMLAARLGEEGFEVVPVGAAPDVVVSVFLGSPDCLLRAALPARSVARKVPA